MVVDVIYDPSVVSRAIDGPTEENMQWATLPPAVLSCHEKTDCAGNLSRARTCQAALVRALSPNCDPAAIEGRCPSQTCKRGMEFEYGPFLDPGLWSRAWNA